MTEKTVSVAEHKRRCANAAHRCLGCDFTEAVAPSHAERAAIVADALKRMRNDQVHRIIDNLNDSEVGVFAHKYTADLPDWRDEFERGARGVWGDKARVVVEKDRVIVVSTDFTLYADKFWRERGRLGESAVAHYLDTHPLEKE